MKRNGNKAMLKACLKVKKSFRANDYGGEWNSREIPDYSEGSRETLIYSSNNEEEREGSINERKRNNRKAQ